MAIRDEQGNYISNKNIGNINYEYDNFTGCQLSVMIGDVVIDEAVSINFSEHQTKTPVYGYASQYWSHIADGYIMVTGSLTINFKESAYLLYPLQRAINNDVRINRVKDYADWQKDYPGLSKSPRYSIDQQGNIINTYTPKNYSLVEASRAARKKRVLKANVEQMFSWDYRGGPSGSPRLQANYNRFWKELGALPDDQFEDYAETFEDAIWYGSEKFNPMTRDKFFAKNIKLEDGDIELEDVLQHRRVDQYPPVDITVVYGDMDKPAVNHTVRKLLDVSFIGQGQAIDIEDTIYEQYQFIARNLL